MRNWDCLRCHTPMTFLKKEKIQLGQTGWLLGDLPNLWAGAMEVGIYVCPTCGKVEFYQDKPLGKYESSGLPQIVCPECGTKHDFDYGRCPFCGHEY